MDEFSFIKEYLSPVTKSSAKVPLALGDDCAVLVPEAGKKLCVSTDAQIEGRHFPQGAPWDLVIKRAIGCAVSDLSAMGAKPLGFTLALALPQLSIVEAEQIKQGLIGAQEVYGCPLVGGDTTQGSRMVSITVIGEVATGTTLLRSNAQAGDDLWLTGEIGGAAFALGDLNEYDPAAMSGFQKRYWSPPNRNEFAQELHSIARACIDVSDGAAGDLAHIMSASGVGVDVFSADVPMPSELLEQMPREQAVEIALSGGDDYELLFTAPVAMRDKILSLSQAYNTPVQCIGVVTEHTNHLKLVSEGEAIYLPSKGYTHF